MARILIVDDEEAIRIGFETFLTADGHEVETAIDGQSGLDKLKAYRPHIVLLDIRMVGMSGLEALPLMMVADPNARIIMLTAVHELEVAKMAIRQGAADYIPKPVHLDHLREVLNVEEIQATG